MLIAFAFSFIGVLLVYGNYKALRRKKVIIAALDITFLLAAIGVYLLIKMEIEDPYFLMGLLSPFFALLLFELVRAAYKKTRGQEIILYLGGLLPKRFEERFVTRLEKLITFLITAAALILAWLAVMLVDSLT